MLAIGVAAAQVAWGMMRGVCGAAAVSYVALAVLPFIALARYSEQVELGDAATWAYVAFLTSMLGVGICVVALDLRSTRGFERYEHQTQR